MTRAYATPKPDVTPCRASVLQRACACGEAAGLSGRCSACESREQLGVQPKLTLNRPGDRYEQEADRIADRVVSGPAPGPQGSAAAGLQLETMEDEEDLQRAPDGLQREMDEEDEEIQAKPAALQREAMEEDEELQRAPAGLLREVDEDDEEIQTRPGALQREAMDEDEELQRAPTGPQRQTDEEEEEIQAKSSSSLGRTPGAAAIGRAASAVSDGGQPLSGAERGYFEPRLGHDFSSVRIHTDARAGAAAKGINARAYTLGNHIAFAQGTRSFTSTEGRRLMAHELVHTVQQVVGRQIRREIEASEGVCGPDWRADGVLAHRQIQNRHKDLFPGTEPHIPHAKFTRSTAGRRCVKGANGKADLWKQKGPLSVIIGEIKPSTPNSVSDGKLQVRNYVQHARESYDRLLGRGRCRHQDWTDADSQFDKDWLQNAADKGKRPMFRVMGRNKIPLRPTSLGPFDGNPKKELFYEWARRGVVKYWCKDREQEDENPKKDANDIRIPFVGDKVDDLSNKHGSKKTDKKADGKKAANSDDYDQPVRPAAREALKWTAVAAAVLAVGKALGGAGPGAAASGAAGGARKKLLGRVLGPVMAGAALAAIVLRPEAVSASGNIDPLEALWKAMKDNGVPVSDEMRQLIESDPELREIVENAAQTGEVDEARNSMIKKTIEVIEANPNAFSDEDLKVLLSATEGLSTGSETVESTVENLKRTIERIRSGRNPPEAEAQDNEEGAGLPAPAESESEAAAKKERQKNADEGGEVRIDIPEEFRDKYENSVAFRDLFEGVLDRSRSNGFTESEISIFQAAMEGLSETDIASIAALIEQLPSVDPDAPDAKQKVLDIVVAQARALRQGKKPSPAQEGSESGAESTAQSPENAGASKTTSSRELTAEQLKWAKKGAKYRRTKQGGKARLAIRFAYEGNEFKAKLAEIDASRTKDSSPSPTSGHLRGGIGFLTEDGIDVGTFGHAEVFEIDGQTIKMRLKSQKQFVFQNGNVVEESVSLPTDTVSSRIDPKLYRFGSASKGEKKP